MFAPLLIGGILGLGLAVADGSELDLEALAEKASSMPPYTFVLRLNAEGVSVSNVPVTGHVVSGYPLHMIYGDLETFTTFGFALVKEGEGEWKRVNYFPKAMLEQMNRSSRQVRGEEKQQDPEKEKPVDEDRGLPESTVSSQTRAEVIRLRQVVAPHEILSRIHTNLENIRIKKTGEETIIVGDLIEAATKHLRPVNPGGGRLRPLSRENPGWDTTAKMRIVIGPNGNIRGYDHVVHFEGNRRGQVINQTLKHSVAFSKIGETTLELTHELKKLLEE